MKKLLVGILTICGSCFSAVQAQNIEGQIISSQYGQWKISGYAPDTYDFSPTACRVQGGASFFPAFTVGTPILIVDGNPAFNEVVTPSSVVINNVSCSISINPIYHHNLPFYLTSATGGLQEAINANNTNPDPNTIILNNAWYQLGGSSGVIASVKGTTQLGLIDVTTIPSTWYRWNGATYAVVPVVPSISSVFGRIGAITAQTGDYTCAQVTGCPTVLVNSFNGRTGVVVGMSGDYTCAQVTGCPFSANVSSVFGRTGAVTAQAGDYTCLLVTGCELQPAAGWIGELSANQASTDTTAAVSLSGGSGVIPSYGYFLVDSEWEYFSSVTSLGGSSYTLNGLTRAQYGTTAASHTSGVDTFGMIFSATSLTTPNWMWVTGTGTSGHALLINCPTTAETGNAVAFDCGANQLTITGSGNILAASSTPSFFQGGIALGTNIAGSYNPSLTSSLNVVQNSVPTQMFQQIGLPNIAGSLRATVPSTIPAATLTSPFVGSGTCNITYEITGIDPDGNMIAGTTVTISNLAAPPFTFPGKVFIQGTTYAGASSFRAYRTAVSAGCGSLALGQWTAAVTNTNYPFFEDAGSGGDSSTPPASTTSVVDLCTNGTQFCILSGTSSTPPVTCTSAQEGWEYHDVAASPAHHAYICESGTWTGVY